MDKGSLAAVELMVFLGLAGWLLYYQFSTSNRSSKDEDTADQDASSDSDKGPGSA